jgi:hypothetical protein
VGLRAAGAGAGPDGRTDRRLVARRKDCRPGRCAPVREIVDSSHTGGQATMRCLRWSLLPLDAAPSRFLHALRRRRRDRLNFDTPMLSSQTHRLDTPPPMRPGWLPPAAAPGLAAVGRRLGRRLADCETLADLLEIALDGLVGELDLRFAVIALRDAHGALGWHVSRSAATLDASRLRDARRLLSGALDSGRPLRAPSAIGGLLAVPLQARGRALGALLVADGDTHPDAVLEDMLVPLASQLAAMTAVLRAGAAVPPAAPVGQHLPGSAARTTESTPPESSDPGVAIEPVVVRHYAADDSVFVADRYLIKGVAGAILWSLLRAHQRDGRRHFTNKELRVDPALRLPQVGDNLEARLILLRRRLAEHAGLARIERTARGRFEFVVEHPLHLVDAG